MNIIAWLEFEILYSDLAVQHFSHYILENSHLLCLLNISNIFLQFKIFVLIICSDYMLRLYILLYDHLPPITINIQLRQTRHAGHCWRSIDELISDVLLWTPTYGRAKAGRPARTYIQQLCEDTGCSPEDLPEVMNDREKWRERIRDIRASPHDMMIILFTQPLRSGRIWHKVNFLSRV